jgi:hypothetical protein
MAHDRHDYGAAHERPHRNLQSPRAPTPFQTTRMCNKLRRYTGIRVRCCP